MTKAIIKVAIALIVFKALHNIAADQPVTLNKMFAAFRDAVTVW